MATNYKVLGQAALTAETNTDVYTVPANTEAVISTIVVCNRGDTANFYRLAVRPNGATLSNEHYITFNTPVEGSDSTSLTIGITVDAGDVITAYGGVGSSITISIFGSEIS